MHYFRLLALLFYAMKSSLKQTSIVETAIVYVYNRTFNGFLLLIKVYENEDPTLAKKKKLLHFVENFPADKP